MSIHVDRAKCVGCGACIEACPGNLIKRAPDGKSYLRRPEDCWGCASCLKECRFGAVSYYLGADVGGRGALMQIEKDGDLSHWVIKRRGEEPLTITVDRKNANKY